MIRYVPVIVVVPESTQTRLVEYVSAVEAQAVIRQAASVMEANGWTAEMVLGGACLTAALGDDAP